MVEGVDHIGIAVKNVIEAAKVYERFLGVSPGEMEILEEQNVKVICFHIGTFRLELLEPTTSESPIAKFLEKKGEGVHHVAFGVSNLGKELQKLEQAGFPLVDKHPRQGANNKRIAFLHPRGTCGILVELCEEKDG